MNISSAAASIIAGIFGALAALASQLAYLEGRRAEPPRYFGGQPMDVDISEDGTRAGGARERAALRSPLYQSSTTAFLVATALVALYAGAPATPTAVVAVLGISIGILQPISAAWRWWSQDRRIVARTEYYVMIQKGAKQFPVDEQNRLFAEQHPNLVRWL